MKEFTKKNRGCLEILAEWIIVFLLIFLGLSWFYVKQNIKTSEACRQPVKYSLGNVDERFGLSKGKALKVILEAESVWENAAGRELFQYDPASSFTINFVYDDRQRQTDELKSLQAKSQNVKFNQQEIVGRYDQLRDEYQQKLAEYKNHETDYKKRLREYNREVDEWNAKGGAPQDIFAQLKAEEKALKKISDELDKEKQEVNLIAEKIRNLSSQEQQLVIQLNQQIETYESKYGVGKEFDQGVYTGSAINIYQFDDMGDLRLTIAHELGHSLGIYHVGNPKSIMYYLMEKQDVDHPKATAEDLQALDSICASQEKTFWEKIKFWQS